MTALFPDFAFVNDENPVGVLDRRQSVRDDQRGAILQQFVSASWINPSVWVSTELVASSRMRIFGSKASALAKDNNWRCPCDKVDTALLDFFVETAWAAYR